jgi:hypothetical protein
MFESRSNADSTKTRNWALIAAGAGIGLAYGVAIRLLASLHANDLVVMSMSFTCILPFAMGAITVYFIEVRRPLRLRSWLLLPWLPLATALAAAMITLLEGLICVVMFLPLAMVLSSVGGLLGGLAARVIKSERLGNASLCCVMALPLLTAPWEKQIFHGFELREVENTIDIQVPPDVIWRNIERVSKIRPGELPDSWSHRIGFPDPVEATLSHEGVGGVRNATFAGGLYFLETVDVWEPERRLAFTIAAQTDAIPATTLDEHVRVGGPYFDVLRGEYRLEALGNGTTRLHLSSRHRISTDFNWYAHLWTDAVMSDLQKRILQVIKGRCEGKIG